MTLSRPAPTPTPVEAPAVPVRLAAEAAFALGEMRVIPSSCQVVVRGKAEALQPRVIQVLVALARRRGAVVSRDELSLACWGGRRVSEDAINRCIQALRRLAQAHAQFSIATIPRVGYRLIEAGRVTELGAQLVDVGRAERAPPAPVERRRLTVLSCGLARPESGGAPLDPEDWRGLVQAWRRVVAEAVSPLGGYVAQGGGDEAVVYFGYPHAREDAAEAAVRAGLAILRGLADVGSARAANPGANTVANPGARLSARIGIHAGAVVIEPADGVAEMFGEATALARRLGALGEAGAVTVSAEVHDLVAGLFLTEALASEPGDSPITAFRVIAPRPTRRRERHFAARAPTPFVGRDEELMLLTSRWTRVGRGEGHVVLLTGEPGMGKTRLVREFRERLRGDAHLWLEGAGERQTLNTPFHPLIALLEQAVGRRGGEADDDGDDGGDDAGRLAALEAALGRGGQTLEQAVPLAADLLGLKLPDRYPRGTGDADDTRRRLLALLASWVLGLAAHQPVVLVMEDLHWADPSTMEVLRALAEQSALSGLLLLCTARPEFRPPWPARSHHVHLTLDRMSRTETRDMVAAVAARAALSEAAIDAVITRADGVPLFAEELARLLAESGVRAGPDDIPATLHDLLAARLDQVGPAKALAGLGSVLGRGFSFALLAAVSDLSTEALRAGLARLIDAELILARGAPPDADYQFKHALIRDVAYDSLPIARRRELHGRAARAITQRFPALAKAQPEIVARHWTRAGEADQAVRAWTAAAAMFDARHAYQEAIEAYSQAMAQLSGLAETPERDARELELLIPLSAVVGVAEGYASDAYQGLGRRGAELAEKSGGLPQLVLQMFVRFIATFMAGQQTRAVALADPLVDFARREGGDVSLRLACMAQVIARNGIGDLAASEAYFAEWSAVVARSGHGQFHGETVAVQAAAVENAWLMGDPGLARERLAQARALAEASRSPFEISTVLMLEAWLCVLRDAPEEAAKTATEALTLAREHRLTHVNQLGSCLAWARAQLGETAEAVRLAELSLSGWVGGGLPRLAEARRVLAHVRFLDGATEAALAELDGLCAGPTENVAILCAHHLLRGELRARIGMTAPARTDLETAIALARRSGARSLERRALRLARQG